MSDKTTGGLPEKDAKAVRLSPEVSELLNMLKSLEATDPAKRQTSKAARKIAS